MNRLMYFPKKDELMREINNLRRKHNINQEQIAEISGIPQSTVSHIIGKNRSRHPKEPTYNEVRKIYNAILQITSPFEDKPIAEIATKSNKVEDSGIITLKSTVSEAAELLVKHGFTQLLVKNNDGVVEWVITDLLLLSQMINAQNTDKDWLSRLKSTPVKSLIERVPIVPENFKQAEVAQMLLYHYAVAINEDKRKYGIATRNDFMQLLR